MLLFNWGSLVGIHLTIIVTRTASSAFHGPTCGNQIPVTPPVTAPPGNLCSLLQK